MKTRISLLSLCILLFLNLNKTVAQCTWQPVLVDDFEYTTPIIGVIMGTTYHNSPQTFAAHGGARSMYMNFVNCTTGTGACAGTKVYERSFTVCENMPHRFSMWLTTTFNAPQSNMKMVIRDANGVVLDSTTSVLAPLSPSWIQYTSSSFISSTPNILFEMYTNVDGGQGNDLSVDDLRFEKCISVSSTRAYSVCANIDTVNLFSTLTNNPVNNGTWTGPSVLTNGYWGTFTNGTNSQGTYLYSSTPYGTAVGCPSRIDTIVAISSANPVVNLPSDTTLCTTQFLSLNAGGTGITGYLWNTNATTSNIIASTASSTNTTVIYSVIVTNQSGCTGTDTINISFIVCTGIDDLEQEIKVSVFPNPSSDFIQLALSDGVKSDLYFVLMDVLGKVVMNEKISNQQEPFSVNEFPNGMYQYQVMEGKDVKAVGKLMIQR
ncbi:MAG: T9SS type A sorting domain-containing protein [Bacteroidetes bacterium]|nr:T9SS type A sorting domain-containing protein [Bacteroidota bacterium]